MHDPVAVVSKARESLRALREAQVIESVTQCSGIACNVATVMGTIALEPTRGTADMSTIATSISDTTVQAFMDQSREKESSRFTWYRAQYAETSMETQGN